MSPQLRGMGFNGPQQQRGAIGLMAAVTLGMVLLFMLLVVDSGRLYLEQRKLQRVADMAVLEAVSRGGTCSGASTAAGFANQSATRNSFTPGSVQKVNTTCGTLSTNSNQLRVFTADATKSDAIRVIATTTVPTSVAGGLWSIFSKDGFNLNTNLTANAVGSNGGAPLAQLTIKSTVLSVTSDQKNLLNLVWGKLLGGSLNLDVIGWQGLVDSKINLLSYLDLLNTDLKLNAGSYNDILNSQLKATDLIDVAIKLLTANGTSSSVAVDGLTKIKVLIGSTKLQLADILKIQTDANSTGLDTSLNVFQLVEAYVQLANKKNGILASIPINIPFLVNGSVNLSVIEPPQLSAIGNPARIKTAADATALSTRIYVKTAQVRAGVTLNLPLLGVPGVLTALSNLTAPLTDVLVNVFNLNLAGALNSLLCVVACDKTDIRVFPDAKTINVVLEAASTESYVTGYTCATNSKTLTTQTNAALVKVQFGKIDDVDKAPPPATSLTVKPLTIVDIGSIHCTALGGCKESTRKPFYGGGIGLSVDTTVASLPAASGPYTYIQPPDINQPPMYNQPKTTGITNSLKTTLSGVHIDVYKASTTGILSTLISVTAATLTALTNALNIIIGDILSSIVDPILDSILSLLGIDLNKVEVGANLSCNQGGRAQLVL